MSLIFLAFWFHTEAPPKYALVSSCAARYAAPLREVEVSHNASNRRTAPPADLGGARGGKGYVAAGGPFSSGAGASGDGQGRRPRSRSQRGRGPGRTHTPHGAPLAGGGWRGGGGWG